MKNRIEGYFGDTTAREGADDKWLWGLRKDARRELIRRLVMERIQLGGYEGAPAKSDLSSLLRHPIVVGVLVAVVSGYVCSKLGVKK